MAEPAAQGHGLADASAGAIAARMAGLDRAPALVATVACATVARTVIGGTAPAGSAPAAIVFTAVLAAAVVLAGARLTRIRWYGVAVGMAGGVALVALSLVGVTVVVGARAPTSTLAWWVPLVSLVASAEELVFRGVLFDAIRDHSGDVIAVTLTALIFAAIHVPLYGVVALPIDLCAGVFLGCLRVATGGVTAPLLAHVIADVGTGWVG